MNIEILTLWLNFLAAIFMGVEYVFNAPLQIKINDWLVAKLDKREKYTTNVLRDEVPVLRERKLAYMLLLIFLVMAVTTGSILAGASDVWPFSLLIGGWSGLLLGVIFAATFLIFMAFVVNVLPAIPFLVFNVLSSMVRKCPKGVIAGFGFCLLLISFGFQFYDAY